MKTGLEIAVIGMAGRFPGAGDIDEFWLNLRNGRETISFFSDDELKQDGIDPSLISNPNYVKAAGIFDDIEYFDASFFGYIPKEAEILDPQARVFHQCVWHALEDAGYDPDAYQGLIGFYAGATPNIGWMARTMLSGKHAEIGNFAASQLTQTNFLTLLISYKLNLKGPSFELNTACSTSLVAIHIACQAILNGECDMALAGGVTIFSSQGKRGYLYQEGMIFSQDGHCRAFSVGSKGIISSGGAGVVVLKRLEDAIKDRDQIYAVIKGSAVNNDGIRKAGFTAPSVEGEAEVIKLALQMSEVESESIGYIETHGTGTELGDPVEIEGLILAFDTNKKGFCALGSVKSNLGHADCAAGVASFIKSILALKNRLIPPTLHFEIPNPHIDFINSPFYINPKLLEWEKKEYPRRAGVSSFGIGGTNAHVVLEEAPPVSESVKKSSEGTGGLAPLPKEHSSLQYQLILLSAKTSTALDRMKINLARYLKENPSINLADAAYTLQVGRRSFNHRWMIVCAAGEDAIRALNSPGAGEAHEVTLEEEISAPGNIEPALEKNMQKSSLIGIGRLWLHGHNPDWRGLYSKDHRRRISLPLYPFERQRYWIEDNVVKRGTEGLKQNSPSNQPQAMSDWFYLPTWKRTALEPQNDNDFLINLKCCWLVFVNDLTIWQALEQQLKQNQQVVILVKAGNEFQQLERGDKHYTYTLDPQDKTHYDLLFKELAARDLQPGKIVHGWNVTGENHCPVKVNGESFESAQYLGFYSLLYLAKTLRKQDFSRDIYIYVMTDHLQEVIGGEVLQPEKSTVLGLLKSIPQENPGIRCRSIDICLPEGEGIQNAALIDALLAEFTIDSTDTAIAYRNNQRWVQIFDPIHLEPPQEEQMRLRKNGVYLVTGGLGNIGLMFAELLVKEAGARLILTGRSFFPPRPGWSQWLEIHDPKDPISLKINKLREIEALGGQVLYIQADSAQYQQMQQAINQAEEAFDTIDGVIHAAGIIEGKSMRLIQDLSEADCRTQFQAKVYGTIILEELLKEKDLDFCWLLSSISCVLGGLGFGAYASSNTFMDVFAKQHNQLNGSRWFSLNWDGMTADKSIAIFKRMLPLKKIDQLVVSREGALHDRIDKWVKLETFKNREYAGSTIETDSGLYPRPDLSTAYTAPQTPTEKSLARIWQNLFGFDKIGIKDDFLELGGDSLKAITVISRIHQELGVNIPVTEFFSRPTIEGSAQYISGRTRLEKNTYISIELAEEKEFYELSSAQKRLYILQQMGVDDTSYNLPYIMRLEGKIEPIRLETIFKNLLERHETLRTSFEMIDDEPVQRIHKKVEFHIEYFEAGKDKHTGLPLQEENIISSFIRPFDLARAPLLRVGLIQTFTGYPSREGNEGGKYILMVDMHHIISDGISLEIFIRDFRLVSSGEHLSLLKLQYKDFSKWQNLLLINEENNKQEEYWLQELGGEIPALDLPTDFPRPPVWTSEGKTIPFELNRDETKLLKELALSEEVTLFILLLSIYNILLSKICNQDDIIVGTPIVGRRHADLFDIIGFFVNTLALRNDIMGQETFQVFLDRVKGKALTAFDNQDYPFESLVDKIKIVRDMSRNPIFSAMFSLEEDIWHNANKSSGKELAGIKIKPYSYEHKVAIFDLVLRGFESEEKMYCSFEFCTKLFKEETIVRFIDYFKRIIRSVVDTPGNKIAEIEITSGEEKNQLLYDFNDTGVDYPKGKTTHRLFEEQAEGTPDSIAVIGSSVLAIPGMHLQITYKELNEKSNRLAYWLQSKSVGADTIVGIKVERSVEMITGIIGILKAGGAYLPIDPEYPEDRINYMLKDSIAKILLTGQEIADSYSPQALKIRPKGDPSHLHLTPAPANSLAYIIYTSGSTGKPKGVMVEHGSAVNLLFALHRRYPLRKRDTYLLKTSYLFDVSVTELFGWFLGSGRLALLEPGGEKDPGAILDMIAREWVTHINFVPSMFHAFVEILEPREIVKLASLKYIFLAGEALPSATVNRFRSLNTFITIENIYGPTEASVYASWYSLSGWNGEDTISIGKPLPNVTLYILDKWNGLQPIGVVGELCIGGTGLARGYLSRPELTAEKFCLRRPGALFVKTAPGPRKNFLLFPPHSPYSTHSTIYRTGDLSRWLPDGNIEFLGRTDHQVKIRGFRIELGEIENCLLRVSGVKEAVVLEREEEGGDKYICAYFVSDSEYGISKLREYLSKELPNYMIPSYFMQIEKIPITPNGKLDRTALLKMATYSLKSDRVYVEPENELEIKITSIWNELLHLEKVGIYDDFFELGGNSKKIIQLKKRLTEELNKNIPVVALFQHPTVYSFVEYLTKTEEKVVILKNEFRAPEKLDRAKRIHESLRKKQKKGVKNVWESRDR